MKGNRFDILFHCKKNQNLNSNKILENNSEIKRLLEGQKVL